MRHVTLNAADIIPPNDADADKLLNAMRNGWIGRPLLVRSDGDEYQALTGAHRLATAVVLGIDVPALLIEDDDLDLDAWTELDEESDAEDFLAFLCQQGLTEAAEILGHESYLNTRNYLDCLRRWLHP
jgi:hypothetical protein